VPEFGLIQKGGISGHGYALEIDGGQYESKPKMIGATLHTDGDDTRVMIAGYRRSGSFVGWITGVCPESEDEVELVLSLDTGHTIRGQAIVSVIRRTMPLARGGRVRAEGQFHYNGPVAEAIA